MNYSSEGKEKTDREILHITIAMAWPAIVESFFVAFVGLADSYMVSSLGADAVAAVGLTTQPKYVALSLFFALNVAVSVLVARRFGEKNREGANRLVLTALTFLAAAAVLLSAIFVLTAPSIMKLCGSTIDTQNGAVTYFRIITGGMIFNCIQMCVNAAQRGAGNTRITMVTNLTSNTVNVLANYLLIGGHFGFPALGIAGAAIATVSGTAVACILSVRSICSHSGFISISYMLKGKILPGWNAFRNIVQVGYSVLFEQLLTRIGLVLTAVMAAHQGTQAMAAHQVGMNVITLSFAFGDGLQSTAVALIGRSLGSGNFQLARRYGRACTAIGITIAAALSLVYYIGAEPLFRMFFRENQIIQTGVEIMHIIIVVVIFQIMQVIYMGCLRGAGDTLYTAKAAMISVTLIRTAVSWFFGYFLRWGINGIWLGVMADQAARYAFGKIRFVKGKWVGITV